jgi:hypothetical protein
MHIEDLGVDLGDEETIEGAWARSRAMSGLLQTLLKDGFANGKRIVLAITQANRPWVKQGIEEQGGPKRFLSAQIGNLDNLLRWEDANVIAVSAVNKIVWKTETGEVVEPDEENCDKYTLIGEEWPDPHDRTNKRFTPVEYPDLDARNPISGTLGMVEFLIAIGGDCDELKPLDEKLRALRNAQFDYANTRWDRDKEEKDRLEAAGRLKKVLEGYAEAVTDYKTKYLSGSGANTVLARAKTQAHLAEEEGAILRWIVAEPLIDKALRDAAAKNQKLPDDFEAAMVDQVNEAIDTAKAEKKHDIPNDLIRWVAPGDLKLDDDWLADQFKKYVVSRNAARQRRVGRIVKLIACAITLLLAYGIYMRPFGRRHAEIDAMLHKCETCMAGLNELGGNGAEKRLEDALARLPGVSPDKPDGGAVEPLGLDPSLYVAEDRPKAIELNDSYKNATDEWNGARNDFKAASTRAAAQASDIRELLKDSGYKDISKAMSETERSLDELNALHALKRPKAEPTSAAVKRFEEVSARADNARAAFSNWMAKADAAVTGAKAAADAFGAASARLESANGRLAAIREEANALRIDRNVPWLSEIRTGITNGITAVESAEDLLKKAMDENPKERARLFDKARGYCREVAGKAAALDNEHGALLPREAVESARKAPNELDGIAKGEESAWENRRRAASALLGRAKAFRDEGAIAIKTLDSLIKEGMGQPDSAHISRLPQKAEDIEKELSAAAASMSTAKLEKRLVQVVSKARKDFEAIEAAKPDIPACRGEIREGAKACMASLKAVGESLGGLKKTVEDGGGVAKAAIQEAVAECARQFDSAEADLRALEGATPANGRDVIKLRGNLDGARNSMDSLRKRVTELDAEIKKAIGEGRFSPASWKEGALAGKPNDALRSKAVLRGDVLCAPGGEASQAYQWEFGLDIDEPGSHKVEVRVSPSARNGVCNLNTAMPIRTFKGGEHGKRSKGGWIKADCILTSGNVRRTNSFFMPNKDPMTPREAVMLEANWQLPKGRASFLLGLNLSVDMRQIEEKDRAKLTDIYKGWNPGGIEIRIFVDGEQVRQFWHLAR